MKKSVLFILAIFFLPAFINVENVDPERQWSQFRGYMSSGVLDQANLPESWDVDKNENVLWSKDIPGLGLSSPVIWGDKLFITTAISATDKGGLKTGIYGNIDSVDDTSEHEWKVYCIDKKTGEIIWEKVSCSGIRKQK